MSSTLVGEVNECWNFNNCVLRHDATLEFVDQTIESLLESKLWRSLCPFLSIIVNDALTVTDSLCDLNVDDKLSKENEGLRQSSDVKDHHDRDLGRELSHRGYFTMSAEELCFPEANLLLTELLAMGVKRLVSHGYPATCILMYDEPWLIGKYLEDILAPATGNFSLGDWFVFSVDPQVSKSYTPGPQHRDRWPLTDSGSFRSALFCGTDKSDELGTGTGTSACGVFQGIDDASAVSTVGNLYEEQAPKYCTAWLALTDATPENSCLYFIPREHDEGYFSVGPGDFIPACINLQNIVAQPLKAGSMVTFSHRIIHWGSNPQPNNQRPRIALSMAFSDKSFEEPYFDHALYLKPFPPLGLRLGLVAGQQVQYEHLERMDKHRVGLYRRIFYSQKHFFGVAYADKISSACQNIAFKLSMMKSERN